MNIRVWIVAMALFWVVGCERASEGDAPATPGAAAESGLTRYCCDRSLENCVPEPEKACTEEDGKPVIEWK